MTASSAKSLAADWRACWAMAGMFALGLQLRGMCCSSLANTSLNLQPHHLLLQHPCTVAPVKFTDVDLHYERLRHTASHPLQLSVYWLVTACKNPAIAPLAMSMMHAELLDYGFEWCYFTLPGIAF